MKKNYVYALIAVLLWSTMAPLVKVLISDFPNMQAFSVSSFISFGFLLLLNLKTGKTKEMKNFSARDYTIMSGLGFLGLFLYSFFYYTGIANMTSQEACIVNYLWPIMLVIFSCIILKEKMTVMKIVAMVCSFVGIIILSSGSEASGGGNVILGIISCFGAAVCYGLFSALNKKANQDQGIAMMIFWLVAAVAALLVGLLTEDWIPINGMQWLGLLWLGIMCDAVPYLFWTIGLNGAANSAKIANIAYLTPFLTVLVSAVFLKEPVRIQALVALVFIVGGILLQYFFDKDKGNGTNEAETL